MESLAQLDRHGFIHTNYQDGTIRYIAYWRGIGEAKDLNNNANILLTCPHPNCPQLVEGRALCFGTLVLEKFSILPGTTDTGPVMNITEEDIVGLLASQKRNGGRSQWSCIIL